MCRMRKVKLSFSNERNAAKGIPEGYGIFFAASRHGDGVPAWEARQSGGK